MITVPPSWKSDMAERLSKVKEDRSLEFLTEPELERRDFLALL